MSCLFAADEKVESPFQSASLGFGRERWHVSVPLHHLTARRHDVKKDSVPPNLSVPFDHRWEPRGIVITYRGELGLDMVLASHAAIAADPRFDALRFAIVDTVLVDKVALIESDIAQINAFLVGPSEPHRESRRPVGLSQTGMV